ncbi:MAG: DeoR/GlpR family DNA-binding transcription regulator, partial [Candidatus Hadarchaeum sp.]|uniref:DeoR/GlpR family DNA-binding transcription regulator n=1 Tax=Candidatus Hadarchaeum sp. TaxID=2883567 RepID=UPI00317819BD
SVSPMTIRNDLAALARKGLIEKVHGGAVVKEPIAAEPSYYEKATRNLEEKRRIGCKAAEMIEEGMAVFIGNGTTTMEIVRALKEKPVPNIRVFTNALTHAVELAEIPGIEVYIIGGRLRNISYALVGPLAQRSLEGIYFDLAFLGANGISIPHGATIPSLEEAETAQAIVKRAQRVALVIDHTKFNIVMHSQVVNFAEISIVVTDMSPPPEYMQLFSDLGINLIVAKGGEKKREEAEITTSVKTEI